MAEVTIIVLNATAYVTVLVLVALGLMVVFGMMRVINMAHGELFMLGAYVVVTTLAAGLPFWLGVVLAPLVVGAFGLVIERALIRHVQRRPLDTILATWGLSIALKQAIVLGFGPAAHSVPLPIDTSIALGALSYPLYRLVLMGLATAIIAACFWLLLGTGFGLQARAVIARPEAAATLGIDVAWVTRVSFALGAALAGLAGALVAPLISVDPQMGLGYLVPAFLAILVGGAGPLAGVLAGGSVIGATDSLLTLWLSPVAAQIVVFILAVVIIRLYPAGLLGGRREG